MTPVEKAALLFAAAAHDEAHPGRTNRFLCKVRDSAALRTAGRDVLECFHASVAFALLADDALDVTVMMEDNVAQQFFECVCAFTVATSMEHHDAQLEEVLGLIECNHSLNLSDFSLRKKILSLLLHAADVSASAKPLSITCEWATRIRKEFDDEARDEVERGIRTSNEVTPSISHPQQQLTFVETVLWPLFRVVGSVMEQTYDQGIADDRQAAQRRASIPLQFLQATRRHWTSQSGKTVEPQDAPPSVPESKAGQLKRLRDRLEEFEHAKEELEEKKLRAREIAATIKNQEDRLKANDKLLKEREALLQQSADSFSALQQREAQLRDSIESVLRVQVEAIREERSTSAPNDDDLARVSISKSSEALAIRERKVRECEADISHRERVVSEREQHQSESERAMKESIAQAAAKEASAKLVLQREQAVCAREKFVEQSHAVAMHTALRSLSSREMESRLSLTLAEVDELLLLSRKHLAAATVVESQVAARCEGLHGLLNRDATVKKAIDEGRERVRHVAQGRVASATPSMLEDLERSVYSLTNVLALIAERSVPA